MLVKLGATVAGMDLPHRCWQRRRRLSLGARTRQASSSPPICQSRIVTASRAPWICIGQQSRRLWHLLWHFLLRNKIQGALVEDLDEIMHSTRPPLWKVFHGACRSTLEDTSENILDVGAVRLNQVSAHHEICSPFVIRAIFESEVSALEQINEVNWTQSKDTKIFVPCLLRLVKIANALVRNTIISNHWLIVMYRWRPWVNKRIYWPEFPNGMLPSWLQ
jgi:hypothetical protein